IQQAVKCFYKRAVPQLETKAGLIAQAPHQQCRMIFIPLHRSRKSTVLRGYFRGVLIKITCMLTAGHGQSYYYCQVMAVRLVQYSAYTGSVPGTDCIAANGPQLLQPGIASSALYHKGLPAAVKRVLLTFLLHINFMVLCAGRG